MPFFNASAKATSEANRSDVLKNDFFGRSLDIKVYIVSSLS